jgi:hypothetical protein
MRSIALACILVWMGGAGARAPQEAKSPALKALLLQADQADGAKARRLRAEVTRQLLDLPPARVRNLLGPPKGIGRQILYRRYLEQWTYDRPVAFGVVFEGLKGQEPRLRAVRWGRPEKQ